MTGKGNVSLPLSHSSFHFLSVSLTLLSPPLAVGRLLPLSSPLFLPHHSLVVVVVMQDNAAPASLSRWRESPSPEAEAESFSKSASLPLTAIGK